MQACFLPVTSALQRLNSDAPKTKNPFFMDPGFWITFLQGVVLQNVRLPNRHFLRAGLPSVHLSLALGKGQVKVLPSWASPSWSAHAAPTSVDLCLSVLCTTFLAKAPTLIGFLGSKKNPIRDLDPPDMLPSTPIGGPIVGPILGVDALASLLTPVHPVPPDVVTLWGTSQSQHPPCRRGGVQRTRRNIQGKTSRNQRRYCWWINKSHIYRRDSGYGITHCWAYRYAPVNDHYS